MIAKPPPASLQRYPNGTVYSSARGRYAPRQQVEDRALATTSVVGGRPNSEDFVAKIVREMKIRYYQPKTIKHYRNALRGLLRWFGGQPH